MMVGLVGGVAGEVDDFETFVLIVEGGGEGAGESRGCCSAVGGVGDGRGGMDDGFRNLLLLVGDGEEEAEDHYWKVVRAVEVGADLLAEELGESVDAAGGGGGVFGVSG